MITWTAERRKLSDLHPWEINPRQIKEQQAKRLSQSFDEFGQVETLAIGPDGEIYNGHQRLAVLLDEHGADYEVDVRVSSRPLDEDERKKLTVFLHQGATGEWDFDLLANHFDVDDLLDWGFEDYQIGIQPDDNEWADAFGALPDVDRAPFQQMTFTLHDTQVETVKEALQASKGMGAFETENENSNGNALARVCELFVGDYGQG